MMAIIDDIIIDRIKWHQWKVIVGGGPIYCCSIDYSMH